MKRIIIIIIVALLAAGLGYGLLSYFGKRSGAKNSAVNNGISQKTAQEKAEVQKAVDLLKKAAENDSDLDGLTNQEEAAAKTDPNSVDTDGDGVNDYDEVKVYKLNPLVKDTLKIGQPDSWAVKNGFVVPGGKVYQELIKKNSKLN